MTGAAYAHTHVRQNTTMGKLQAHTAAKEGRVRTKKQMTTATVPVVDWAPAHGYCSIFKHPTHMLIWNGLLSAQLHPKLLALHRQAAR